MSRQLLIVNVELLILEWTILLVYMYFVGVYAVELICKLKSFSVVMFSTAGGVHILQFSVHEYLKRKTWVATLTKKFYTSYVWLFTLLATMICICYVRELDTDSTWHCVYNILNSLHAEIIYSSKKLLNQISLVFRWWSTLISSWKLNQNPLNLHIRYPDSHQRLVGLWLT